MQVLVLLLVISLVYDATEALSLPPYVTHRNNLRHRATRGDFVAVSHARYPPASGKLQIHDAVDARSEFRRGPSGYGPLGAAHRHRSVKTANSCWLPARLAFSLLAAPLARRYAIRRRRSSPSRAISSCLPTWRVSISGGRPFEKFPNLLRQTASPNKKSAMRYRMADSMLQLWRLLQLARRRKRLLPGYCLAAALADVVELSPLTLIAEVLVV